MEPFNVFKMIVNTGIVAHAEIRRRTVLFHFFGPKRQESRNLPVVKGHRLNRTGVGWWLLQTSS